MGNQMRFYDRYETILQTGRCCKLIIWDKTDPDFNATFRYYARKDEGQGEHYDKDNTQIAVLDTEVTHFKEYHLDDWKIAILADEVFKRSGEEDE